MASHLGEREYSATVEYVWLDADGNFRSKTREVYSVPIEVEVEVPVTRPNGTVSHTIEKVVEHRIRPPIWNYDGSSTGQAKTGDSEIVLVPKMITIDPFNDSIMDVLRRDNKRLDDSKEDQYLIALCETYYYPDTEDGDLIPTKENRRYEAEQIFKMEEKYHQCPWFGMEQEYVIYATKENSLGIPISSTKSWGAKATSLNLKLPPSFKDRGQGKYYCGTGASNAYGRALADLHYKVCKAAGIPIAGKNAEVAPCQWEFQLFYRGNNPIEAGDYMFLARYFLERVAENFGVDVTFNPKPYALDTFNRSGCHINFSYKKMREIDDEYANAVKRLEKVHPMMIKEMGTNDLRLTGSHETSKMTEFTYGIADRTATIRIPREVARHKVGYIEYRAPASDVNPYIGTSRLYQHTIMAACEEAERALHEELAPDGHLTTIEEFTGEEDDDEENEQKTKDMTIAHEDGIKKETKEERMQRKKEARKATK